MVFSSAVFLFLFLPVVILLHTFIKNTNLRNGLLILASLFFYAYGEPVFIVLLLVSVTFNYFLGGILAKNKNKAILGLCVVTNLLLLVVFKYTDFLIEIINYIPGINFKKTNIRMPIGISFFTFQAISYVIDVYRADDNEKPGFFQVLLYISLFPQLIAGPIVKYNSVKEQIKNRTVTLDGLTRGVRRFVMGLSKKMLVANAMAYVADKVFAMSTGSIDSGLAWVGGICYTFQIFFDFSGYSDMALGLGAMMGFDFPENFNYPYVASGIRDFWRRWHMSLTSWFREYLYIPLGGNRKGRARQIINTLIVFTCTGIWHGANFTFLVWGLMHGILMMVETLVTKKKEQKFNFFKWLYTMLFVIIGFVIFRADNIAYAFRYIGRMFAFVKIESSAIVLASVYTPIFIVTLVIAIIASTPLFKKIVMKYEIAGYISYAITLLLLVLCIMSLAADSYNPFIYFRF